ncbi:MAG: hypothetical protein RTU92_00920 [Candidatus Thorarchaeota archaeon]
MSMAKMNFSKISQMKKQASRKTVYYGFLSLMLLIVFWLSMGHIPSFQIFGFGLFLFFFSLCLGLFSWNLFTLRTLSILESVVDKVE